MARKARGPSDALADGGATVAQHAVPRDTAQLRQSGLTTKSAVQRFPCRTLLGFSMLKIIECLADIRSHWRLSGRVIKRPRRKKLIPVPPRVISQLACSHVVFAQFRVSTSHS